MPTPKIALIAALSVPDRVIGADGDLPWHISEDLKYFKRVTLGHPLIMGRKTYASIGRPLPGRHNIIVTRNRAFTAPGCTVVHSPEAALAAAQGAEKVFIGGGETLYRAFLPQADELHLTYVETAVAGDTFFPEIERQNWKRVLQMRFEPDGKNTYRYTREILKRAASN